MLEEAAGPLDALAGCRLEAIGPVQTTIFLFYPSSDQKNLQRSLEQSPGMKDSELLRMFQNFLRKEIIQAKSLDDAGKDR